MVDTRLTTTASIPGTDQQATESASFSDVTSQPAWEGLTLQQKEEIADDWKNKYLRSQPAFQQLDGIKKLEIETDFNKKYGVGKLAIKNPVDAGLTGFGLAAGTLTEPFTKSFTFGLGDNVGLQANLAQQQFPGIQTDPGLLGDLYRFNQNPISQIPGSLLGAFSNVSGIAKGLPTSWGNASRAVGSVAPFSGLTNLISTFKGEQNPVEALSNTATDIATAPIQLGGRFVNAALQGATGYGAGFFNSIISDITNGRPVDIERAKQRAMQEGALGAGAGAAFGGGNQTLKANARYINTQQGRFKVRKQQGRFTQQLDPRVQQFVANIQNQLRDAQTRVSLKGEKESMQAQLRALEQLYNKLYGEPIEYQGKQRFSARAQMSKEAEASRKQIEDAYRKLRAEYEAKFPKTQAAKSEKKSLKGNKKASDYLVQMGLRMRAQGGVGKAKFEAVMSRYNKEDKALIYGRIKDAEAKAKAKADQEKAAKKARKAAGQERVKQTAKQRQDAKKAAIKAENERIKLERERQAVEEKARKEQEAAAEKARKERVKAEQKAQKEKEAEIDRLKKEEEKLKKQQDAESQRKAKLAQKAREKSERELAVQQEKARKAAEKDASDKAKQAEALKKLPRVLSDEEIESASDALLKNFQNNEKGTLDANLAKARQAAKTDFTKRGLSKDRSDAINSTYQRVIDRYTQKKAEFEASRKKPTPEQAVKRNKQNRAELDSIRENGGKVDEDAGTFKQKPVRPEQLTIDDVIDYIPESDRDMALLIDQAARKDGYVTIRYDAERSGDTGQFEYKTVAPIDWAYRVNADGEVKILFHGVNKYGHTAEYYFTPSDPNTKTGTVSQVLDVTYQKGSEGTAFRNGDANVYKGAREGKIADILGRPLRETVGLTSETRNALEQARSLIQGVDANRQAGADSVEITAKAAKAVKKAVAKAKKKQKVSPEEVVEPAKYLKDNELKGNLNESNPEVHKQSTGDDC